VPNACSYDCCIGEDLPVSIKELYEELLEETGDEADRMTTEAVAMLLKTSQSASCSRAARRARCAIKGYRAKGRRGFTGLRQRQQTGFMGFAIGADTSGPCRNCTGLYHRAPLSDRSSDPLTVQASYDPGRSEQPCLQDSLTAPESYDLDSEGAYCLALVALFEKLIQFYWLISLAQRLDTPERYSLHRIRGQMGHKGPRFAAVFYDRHRSRVPNRPPPCRPIGALSEYNPGFYRVPPGSQQTANQKLPTQSEINQLPSLGAKKQSSRLPSTPPIGPPAT
jgi:hypothetical protein